MNNQPQANNMSQVDNIPQVDNTPQVDNIPQIDNIIQVDNIPQIDNMSQVDNIPQVDVKDAGSEFAQLANNLYEKNDFNGTIEYFNKASDAGHSSPGKLHYIVANAYYKTKDYDAALYYSKLALENEYYPSVQLVGLAYNKLKDEDKTLEYISKSIEFCEEGLIDKVLVEFEPILKDHLWYNQLVGLYIVEQDSVKILELLNKIPSNALLEPTIEKLKQYFNDVESDNLLHKLIKNMLRAEIDLCEIDSKYEPNPEGHKKAKADFFDKIAQNTK